MTYPRTTRAARDERKPPPERDPLYELLRRCGLSRKALALRAAMPESTIRAYEVKGFPEGSRLRVAGALLAVQDEIGRFVAAWGAEGE